MKIKILAKTLLDKIGILKECKQLFSYGLPYYKFLQWVRIRKIRKKGIVNVVYYAINVPMWRYQGVYDLLKKDKRFVQQVVILSSPSYSDTENVRLRDELISFFTQRGMVYILLDDLDQERKIKALNPDIIFFAQHYSVLPPNVDSIYFKNRLLAYIPYCLFNGIGEWRYNNPLQLYAWRLYYPTRIHIATARKYSDTNGRNIRVVGEPHADDFLSNNITNVWKDNRNRKHIIWAPHFLIHPYDRIQRSSFLWISEFMLKIAEEYKDEIFIAFKPHPRLYSELCIDPNWGEEKANQYYNKWNEMENTQFENGEFIDLFKGSDALIHDCSSFMSEYLFVKKPCLFITKDISVIRDDSCVFGNKCLDMHYVAKETNDIIDFIEKVVLEDNDILRNNRDEFFTKYLLPPNGMLTSENVYNDIVKSIFN